MLFMKIIVWTIPNHRIPIPRCDQVSWSEERLLLAYKFLKGDTILYYAQILLLHARKIDIA